MRNVLDNFGTYGRHGEDNGHVDKNEGSCQLIEPRAHESPSSIRPIDAKKIGGWLRGELGIRGWETMITK